MNTAWPQSLKSLSLLGTAALCVAIVALPLAAQTPTLPKDSSLPEKVGEVGDVDNLVFEGIKTFTADQIRHALAVKSSYLLAAHPQANLRPFLEDLQSKVLTGYQAAGFPDARVEVTFDRKDSRAHVKVTEGPRFFCGKIRVVGNKSSSSRQLVRWFTTRADSETWERKIQSSLSSTNLNREDANGWKTTTEPAGARTSGLQTPGTAERPDDPMWVKKDPADFSGAWAANATAQVETCLAEQGFFFPQAKVELQRNMDATADLLITIVSEGPPGIIGEITVAGQERNQAEDILRFLRLRKGSKITAASLAEARRKLNDCGRFWDFAITPEYPGSEDKVTSRHVNLRIAVAEQEGVPRLNEPLSPVQQALIRVCEWLEQFPKRNEEIRLAIHRPEELPMEATFVLSPKRGFLLSAELEEVVPVSAGFLIANDTVELCAWSAGHKASAPRQGGGTFFLHLLPDNSNASNRFNLSVGGGYSGTKGSGQLQHRPVLKFDVQLSRAAFLDITTRTNSHAEVVNGRLRLENEGVVLQADARTGRILELTRTNAQAPIEFQFGQKIWKQQETAFLNRSKTLTNLYAPDSGWSSVLSILSGEAGRVCLAQGLSVTNAEQQRLASAAIRRLTTPEILHPLDWIFPDGGTNSFIVPMDDLDRAMALNNVASVLSGIAFDWSTRMFPKYSWPWTATRESAFVLMSQGRYTDVELERLYNSKDTGPIGCLVLSRLLAAANSPAAKGFAMQGLMRLDSQDFLRDCKLFLEGESGLARTFAKVAEALRNLPADELAALATTLPSDEATLLRESATALRAHPEAKPDAVLSPIIARYWQDSLRTKVRAALYQLTTQSASGRNASL
jgi:hypothetical protein